MRIIVLKNALKFFRAFCLCFFVSCSDATGANVFGGFFSVDFHFYLLQIGAVSFGCLSVRVRNLVAWHFAFSAYSTYLGHIYTSVGRIVCVKFTPNNNNIFEVFWQANEASFFNLNATNRINIHFTLYLWQNSLWNTCEIMFFSVE